MILIISHPDDIHAHAVIEHLPEFGATAHLLNLSHFPVNARLSLRYGATSSRLAYTEAGTEIDLDQFGAVWWRRPQPLSFEQGLNAPDFAAAECDEALAGLWQAMDAGWINPPVQDAAAARKSWQLRLAGRLGLNPPETLITNCPEQARDFVARLGDVIYKPFAGSVRYWRETRRIDAEALARIDQIRHAPTILQERITGTDIRVTVVGGRIFAAAIDSSQGNYADDFRMNHQVSIHAIDLPAQLCVAINALMTELGLIYGALDFRRQPDGRFRFLEINPAGQWLFVEEQTGQLIARAMAQELAMIDAGRVRPNQPRPCPGPRLHPGAFAIPSLPQAGKRADRLGAR